VVPEEEEEEGCIARVAAELNTVQQIVGTVIGLGVESESAEE